MTSPDASVLLSDISVEDQLKFLRQSVQRHNAFSQTLKDGVVSQLNCLQNDIIHHTNERFGSSDSGMLELHRDKLIGLRAYLCENMEPKYLLTHLFAERIITEDIQEEIRHKKPRRPMCEKLLSILPLRGKNAYSALLEALRREEQDHLADEIEKFDPYAQKTEAASQDMVASRPDQLVFPPSGGEPYAIVPLRFLQGSVVTPMAGSHVTRQAPALDDGCDDTE